MSIDPLQEWLDEVSDKEQNGTLTYKEAPIGSYLCLTSGKYKDRIVFKFYRNGKIDEKEITHFANTMTWVYIADIENETCYRTAPNSGFYKR